MNKRIIFAFLMVLFFIAVWYLFWPRQYIIELRADGFYPHVLTVPAGSTIIFVNNTDDAFWPASNFHPSHKLYPEFDAQKIIPSGHSWQFVMHRVGVWRYHDHLTSKYGGVIRVRVSPWAQKFLCRDETCFIQEIEIVLQKKGIDVAFERFSELYESNPSFSSTCHDVTHLLGEAAYREYKTDGKIITTSKTSYCGYGFYHGFIEGLLFTTGNFDEAKDYCWAVQQKLLETIVAPNAIYSCYHGIGHGAFDTQNFSEWGDDEGMLVAALSTCQRVTQGDEPELVKQCATGVFNGLVNAYVNKTYNLSFDPVNPWNLCEVQNDIEYKKACFREVAASYLRGEKFDFKKAMEIITLMPDRIGANASMNSYMAEEARSNMDAPTNVWAQICQRLAAADMQISCTEGVVAGLFLWGKPGHENENAVAFCNEKLLSSSNKNACFSYVLPRLKTVFTNEKTASICATIGAAYQKYCL